MKSTTADLCIDYSFKFLFISINHDLILNSQNQFTRFWGFNISTTIYEYKSTLQEESVSTIDLLINEVILRFL